MRKKINEEVNVFLKSIKVSYSACYIYIGIPIYLLSGQENL